MRKVKVSAVQMKCTTDVWENIANAENLCDRQKKTAQILFYSPNCLKDSILSGKTI